MKRHELSVVYFGMTGAFSRPPLDALLHAGIAVRAVALPAPTLTGVAADSPDAPFVVLPPRPSVSAQRRALPMLAPESTSETIVQLAAAHNIPVLELRHLSDPRTVAALTAFTPDAICVACFSRRVPTAILHLPRLGCLNVHPSLLPANRGPDPLFWTFRHGDTTAGVTIHVMDEGLDSGPIATQQAIPIVEGMTKSELESTCANVGGELLVEALYGLAEGHIVPQAQDERLAMAYPWPPEDDFVITPDRPARWAYNFACGLSNEQQPIRIIAPSGVTFRLAEPLGYDAGATLAVPYRLTGDELALRCAPGVFYARVASGVD